MVTLAVGDKATFYVDKELLCRTSVAFKAAFSLNFKEGKNLKIDFPDEHPAVIKRFVFWAYNELFYWNSPLSITLWELLSLFLFAEKWLIEGLVDACYNGILQQIPLESGLCTFEDCYAAWEMVRYSKIRFLICRRFSEMVGQNMGSGIETLRAKMPIDSAFLQDVIFAREAILEEYKEDSEWCEDYDDYDEGWHYTEWRSSGNGTYRIGYPGSLELLKDTFNDGRRKESLVPHLLDQNIRW